MDELWIKNLKQELLKPLPGIEAQRRLSPPARHLIEPDQRTRKSAVLILLFPVENKPYTVFIKRPEYNGVHSGQVSLPGGMFKDTDDNLENTAIRETWEEVGIHGDHIHVIGKLTSLHIPVSGTIVFPFVGVCTTKPVFRPDPFEVKYVIETGIEELLNPLNQKQKIMVVGDHEIEIPYFDIHGEHIWGATAMIISEFLEIAEKTGSKK